MKRLFPYCLLVLGFSASSFDMAARIEDPQESEEVLTAIFSEAVEVEEILEQPIDSIQILDPVDLFNSLSVDSIGDGLVNRSFLPRVFGGYRKIRKVAEFSRIKPYNGLKVMTDEPLDTIEPIDASILPDGLNLMEPADSLSIDNIVELDNLVDEMGQDYVDFAGGRRPKWLSDALLRDRIQEDVLYNYMIENPQSIEYADWDLPEPPILYEDDVTFLSYIKRQNIPTVNKEDAVLPQVVLRQIHWLHIFNAGVQFSQAFVSPNWYQGGNNYLSLLFNFNWNVQLNEVYHPNLLFQSNLSYKLAFSSTPNGSIHKYTISEDLFQYNMNAGLKAFKGWYYSFNLMFKTQMFHNYEENSNVRTASFLSPGELNLGLGMSYNHKNKKGNFKYTLTVSPLSYNLKTCISNVIDHALYNIPQNRKSKSEIGSNAELNLEWKIMSNISYKTRLFLFSDYSYLLSDWQNTFNFDINKFLSTQLFLHLRYDTSAERNTKWKTFMMREILSFGLSYTFSTKP